MAQQDPVEKPILLRDFSKGRYTQYSVSESLVPINSVKDSLNVNFDTIIGKGVARPGTTRLGGTYVVTTSSSSSSSSSSTCSSSSSSSSSLSTSITYVPSPVLLTPNTANNDSSEGTLSWTNIDNIKGNSSYATNAGGFESTLLNTNTVKLVVGGSITGNNKGGNTITSGDYSYGGAGDTWGISLTPSQVNSSNFGVVVNFSSPSGITYLAKGTNFGFALPPSSSVVGVTATIFAQITFAPGNFSTIYLNNMRLTVYYT